MELENKTAIVTGGGRGIGAAISVELAKQGANVAVVYHSNSKSADKVVDEIRALGRKAVAIQTDVSKFAEVSAMVARVREELGEVDILVNNAGGIVSSNLLRDQTEEVWDATIALNLKSVFNTCRNVIEGMIERGSGNIVNIGSNAGLIGQARTICYASAKAGMVVFTRTLAKEVSSLGIRVNSVSCGPIATDAFYSPDVEQSAREALEKGTGLNRVGTPQDIANAVAFLVSDKAGFITGQDIPVCGLRNWGGPSMSLS